jgi:transposase
MKLKPSPTRSGNARYPRLSRRPPRHHEVLQQRRLKAAEMFKKGTRPAEVARVLGVSCRSACTWRDAWLSQGVDGLKGAGRAGRPPKLEISQLEAVETVLLQGARSSGFNTDLWTLERVAAVIQRRTGVSYHPGHVWRLLRFMGWSRQQPSRRAVERDDDKIAHWIKTDWPRVKKTPDDVAPGSSSRTKAASH